MTVTTFLIPFLVALITTLIATPLSIPLIKKWKLIDDPKRAHPAILHKIPIPRGGGLPLYIGIIVTGIFFLPLTKVTITLFIASFIALIIGLIDDRFGDLSRYFRFLSNIFVAALVVGAGISIPFITSPFGGILHLDAIRLTFSFIGTHSVLIFSDIVAAVWIVWVMNMLNWSKGIDGQMPGILVISAIVIGLLTLRFPLSDQHTYIAAMLSFIIAGASLGFLPFNFHPAKLFLGYGATAVYLLLAVVALLSSAKLATAVLVMGVPMFDAFFTIIRRILSKKSPLNGDRKHLHHLLLDKGWGHRKIALFYWAISAIVGLIALQLSSKEKLFAIIMLAVIVGGALIFLHRTVKVPDDTETTSL